MRFDIITCLPQLLISPFNNSILKRAQDKGLVTVEIHDLRDYATDRNRTTDDYAFGGGAGMVMKIEPIYNCIEALKKIRSYDEVIFLCPDGDMLNQSLSNQLSMKKNLILLCGHYKGVDERVRQHLITKEISIGNYVISGGELAAAVLADSVIRLLPGVLTDESSALTDSFQDNLLAPAVYTRPTNFMEWAVPEILLSGNKAKIEEWRHQNALQRTSIRRPDLLDKKK